MMESEDTPISYNLIANMLDTLIESDQHVSGELFRNFLEDQLRHGLQKIRSGRTTGRTAASRSNASKVTLKSKTKSQPHKTKSKVSAKQSAKETKSMGIFQKILGLAWENSGIYDPPEFLSHNSLVQANEFSQNQVGKALAKLIELAIEKVDTEFLVNDEGFNQDLEFRVAAGQERHKVFSSLLRKKAYNWIMLQAGVSEEEARTVRQYFPIVSVWAMPSKRKPHPDRSIDIVKDQLLKGEDVASSKKKLLSKKGSRRATKRGGVKHQLAEASESKADAEVEFLKRNPLKGLGYIVCDLESSPSNVELAKDTVHWKNDSDGVAEHLAQMQSWEDDPKITVTSSQMIFLRSPDVCLKAAKRYQGEPSGSNFYLNSKVQLTKSKLGKDLTLSFMADPSGHVPTKILLVGEKDNQIVQILMERRGARSPCRFAISTIVGTLPTGGYEIREQWEMICRM